jgi:hypothetical protein
MLPHTNLQYILSNNMTIFSKFWNCSYWNMSRSNSIFNASKLTCVDATVITPFESQLHDSYTEPCPALYVKKKWQYVKICNPQVKFYSYFIFYKGNSFKNISNTHLTFHIHNVWFHAHQTSLKMEMVQLKMTLACRTDREWEKWCLLFWKFLLLRSYAFIFSLL